MIPYSNSPGLELDPEIEAFIRRRNGGFAPLPESVSPPPPTAVRASPVPLADVPEADPAVSGVEAPPLRPATVDAPRIPAPSRANEPTPDDEYRAAAEADRKAAESGALALNLSRAAALYRGDKAGQLAIPVPTNVREFLERRKLAGGATDPVTAAKLALIRAQIEKARAGGKPDEPAPAEWGAPAGTTKADAIRLGYGRAPKPEKDSDQLADASEIEELKAAGFPYWLGMTKGEYRKAKRAVWGAEKNKEAAVAAAGRTVEVTEKKEQVKREADIGAARARFGDDWEPKDTSPLLEDDTSRRDFLASMEKAARARELSAELRTLISGGAGFFSDASVKTRTQAIVADLLLLQKDINKLGVLSTTDVTEFLNPQLADPAKFDSAWKEFAGQRDPKAQIDQYIKSLNGTIRRKAKTYAVRPKAGGQFADINLDDAPAASAASGAEKPPRPGALRTKSGRWAIQNAKGEWEYLYQNAKGEWEYL